MYIKLNNGVPEKYTIEQLRKDNPNVSFPKSIDINTLQEYEVYPATEGEKPSFNSATQNCLLEDIATQINNAWVYSWVVTDKTADEIENKNNFIASEVRDERNQKLKDTDWMGMSDVTMSTEWATYRQALRDVPAQAGFPHTIVWPTKPE